MSVGLRLASAVLSLLAVCIGVPADAQSAAFVQAVQSYQQLYNQRNYLAALPFAKQAVALARDESLSDDMRANALNHLAELYYLTGSYAEATAIANEVLTIREHETLTSYSPEALAGAQEDVAELLDLQGKTAQAAVLHQRAAGRFDSSTRSTAPSSALGRQDYVVHQSILDFFDTRNREDGGYGRYTYVLFPGDGGGNCDRCKALLTAFSETGTPPGPVNQYRDAYNVFEVPVQPGRRDEARGAAGNVSVPLKWYDFAMANALATSACLHYGEASQKFCGTLQQGPYLVTYPRPVGSGDNLPAPYLIVNLSDLDARVFPLIIRRMKEEVAVADLRDESRIRYTWARTVSLILMTSDVLDKTTPALVKWIKIIPSGSGTGAKP